MLSSAGQQLCLIEANVSVCCLQMYDMSFSVITSMLNRVDV